MIGQRIRLLRNEKELLQKDLAKQLNLSQQTISLYESNKREPDYETLKKIADFFCVSIDYLLGRTDIKKSLCDENNVKESNKAISTANKLSEEIGNLSPESQEEIKKLIELYKIKDMQDRNAEFSDEISKQG